MLHIDNDLSFYLLSIRYFVGSFDVILQLLKPFNAYIFIAFI